MSVKFYLLLFFLSINLSSMALIPGKYLGADYNLNAKVKMQINKTFDAIDKFDKVELGSLMGVAVVFDYNAKGNVSKIREYTKDGILQISYVLEYNAEDLPEAVKKYGKDEHLERYDLITHKNGKKIEEKVYSGDGQYTYSEVYSYNHDGFLIEKKRMNVQGKVQIIIGYEYDSIMRISREIRKTGYKENYFGSRKEFTYDGNGRVSSETVYNSEGSIKIRKTFQYDDKGNIIEEISSYPQKAEEIMKYTYEYDTHGNWIKKIHYTNQYTPTLVQMRRLEY